VVSKERTTSYLLTIGVAELGVVKKGNTMAYGYGKKTKVMKPKKKKKKKAKKAKKMSY